MFPIGDDNSSRTITPYVNYLLIALNIFVFIFVQGIGSNPYIIASFSTVPAEIISGQDIVGNGLGPTPIPVYATIITSMFMHGSIGHIAGNMLYLWIFGDNLENVMGHSRYLLFYLICGILASLSHVFIAAVLGNGLYVPSLGASGAISGVLGGYLILFPKNRVRIFALPFIFRVPAIITLGLWIIMQIVSQWNSIRGQEDTGVAYAAHIGGFFAGVLLVRTFIKRPASLRS